MKNKWSVRNKGRNEKLDMGLSVGILMLCILSKYGGKVKRFNYFMIVRKEKLIKILVQKE